MELRVQLNMMFFWTSEDAVLQQNHPPATNAANIPTYPTLATHDGGAKGR